MKDVRIGVFAYDCEVGISFLRYLIENYSSQVKIVCSLKKDSEITRLAKNNLQQAVVITDDEIKEKRGIATLKDADLDYIILAWWPNIIPEEIINIPKIGVLNFHPGLLPFNAGKNTNFWTIVDEKPFGVTIHFVDTGIDSGDIVFQKRIEVSWEDTGESLYRKEIEATISLFKESYPKLVLGDYQRKKQDISARSFHYAKDMHRAKILDLDKEYMCRDLLNLLRAKTFRPYEGCIFYDGDKEYEVKVSIREIKK